LPVLHFNIVFSDFEYGAHESISVLWHRINYRYVTIISVKLTCQHLPQWPEASLPAGQSLSTPASLALLHISAPQQILNTITSQICIYIYIQIPYILFKSYHIM